MTEDPEQRPDLKWSPLSTDLQLEPSPQQDHFNPHGTADIEILNPHHECASRRSTVLPATFNLVATIVGGGILSVPLAFEKCGLLLTTVLLIVSAICTDFSLYILCSCARRTGATTYVEVCRLAYGPGLELFITLILSVFLLFVIVAFMVLIRDIFTPTILPAARPFLSDEPDLEAFGDSVLLGIVVIMSPFLLKKDLHALRYNCYVGFISISVLCLAIAYRAWEKYPSSASNGSLNIKVFPSSLVDVLFAFPIPILSFMCQFNVNGIQGSLINPTRQRIRRVIDSAIIASFFLTYSFGLAGYLYGGDETNGNILLNFDPGDRLIIVGKVGCGVTITLAVAIVFLPCRETLLSLGPQFRVWKQKKNVENGIEAGEETTSLPTNGNPDQRSSNIVGNASEDTPLLSEGNNSGEDNETFTTMSSTRMKDILIHFGSTLAIVTFCYICAVAAPGVAVVWSICGSSMAFIIAFILPSVCYIRIRATKKGHTDARVLSAWALLVFSVSSAILCTAQTIWRFFN